MVIDIVIGTRNRVEMLKRTLACIRERTRTPYTLTIIDDASTDGTPEFLKTAGAAVHRHATPRGMHGNLVDVFGLTQSDPVICTDDDVLCPLLEPDWLARLLREMETRPMLWMLGLNNPFDNGTGSREPYREDGAVVYSRFVSGHFLAMRRSLLGATRGLFDGKKKTCKSPNKTQARWVHAQGARVGYLRDVYAWHYCPTSQRREGVRWNVIEPINPWTLEPPGSYRQGQLVAVPAEVTAL